MFKHVGDKINKLSYKIKREISKLPSIQKIDEVSATNGFILMYIYDSKEDVFQKDIENHFGMTRSTASRVISLMEQKNLLTRESVLNDHRLKKLTLTDKSKPLCVEVKGELKEFEKRLCNGVDLDYLIKELDLINLNLNGGKSND